MSGKLECTTATVLSVAPRRAIVVSSRCRCCYRNFPCIKLEIPQTEKSLRLTGYDSSAQGDKIIFRAHFNAPVEQIAASDSFSIDRNHLPNRRKEANKRSTL